MSDHIWKRDEPESPCQNICVIHPAAKICIGCQRSAEEISQWAKLSPDERRKIMDELPERAVLLKGKRRKRPSRQQDQ